MGIKMEKEIGLGVSLFSFGYEYATRKLDLEGCMRIAHEIGYEGIELVSAQMVPGYPYPTHTWCEQVKESMSRYQLKPYAYGSYVDMARYTGRNLTEEEIFQYTLNDMQIAQKLGFKILKTNDMIGSAVLERLIEQAEKRGIWIGVELHHPNSIYNKKWTPFMELFSRVGSQYIGIVPDTGMFAGKNPSFMEELDAALIYSKYVHGKFFHINAGGVEGDIDFPTIVAHLKKNGYKGLIAAEYEGYFHDATIDTVAQLKRFYMMMIKLLYKAERKL